MLKSSKPKNRRASKKITGSYKKSVYFTFSTRLCLFQIPPPDYLPLPPNTDEHQVEDQDVSPVPRCWQRRFQSWGQASRDIQVNLSKKVSPPPGPTYLLILLQQPFFLIESLLKSCGFFTHREIWASESKAVYQVLKAK